MVPPLDSWPTMSPWRSKSVQPVAEPVAVAIREPEAPMKQTVELPPLLDSE